MKDLRDRVVVITGAASGIGRATVEAFLGRGARVYGADLDEAGLDRLADAVGSASGRASGRFVPCRVDVRLAEAVQGLADQVFGAEGRVDVLFNNAGVVVCGRVESLSLDDWRRALDINLYGVVHGIWAFVPRMIRQGGGGHIVSTASVAGVLGIPLCAPYSASKFGVVGLAEALQGELAASDLHVTTFCPGMVRTALLEHGTLELPPGGRGLLERAVARFALSPEAVAAEVLRAVERGQSGTRVLGLGTRPLWWARRLTGRGYDAATAALSRRVLSRPVAVESGEASLPSDSNPRESPRRWGVLIVHPSRRESARDTAAALAARLLSERPGFRLWTLQTPTRLVVEHAQKAPAGATFHLVPLLLAPGAHFHEDVARLAEEVRQAAPRLQVEVKPPLLEDAEFLGWLFDRLMKE